MTIVEQAENELRLLMLCKPSTARALIDEVKRLRAELAGKRTSPEVSTQMECPDCHAVTRWGRHLDLDCDTIARLRNLIEDAPHTTSCSIWGDMIDTRTGKRPPIECDCWKRAALEGK